MGLLFCISRVTHKAPPTQYIYVSSTYFEPVRSLVCVSSSSVNLWRCASRASVSFSLASSPSCGRARVFIWAHASRQMISKRTRSLRCTRRHAFTKACTRTHAKEMHLDAGDKRVDPLSVCFLHPFQLLQHVCEAMRVYLRCMQRGLTRAGTCQWACTHSLAMCILFTRTNMQLEYIHVYTYICIYMCVRIYMCVFMYKRLYVYMYIYVYTDIYI